MSTAGPAPVRRGAAAGLLALCALLSWTCAQGQDAGPAVSSRTWNFEVQLDGKPIGSHRFSVVTLGERTTVESRAQFEVRLLGILVYRYRHESAESWRGGCLASLRSRTDDNGDRFVVDAEAGPEGLRVKTRDGSDALAGCVMGFAYWDPAMLARKNLLNSQNGVHQAVVVGEPVADEVLARGRLQAAQRYHLTGPDNPLDLWYSRGGDWLGLESTVSGGRRLRYLLQP